MEYENVSRCNERKHIKTKRTIKELYENKYGKSIGIWRRVTEDEWRSVIKKGITLKRYYRVEKYICCNTITVISEPYKYLSAYNSVNVGKYIFDCWVEIKQGVSTYDSFFVSELFLSELWMRTDNIFITEHLPEELFMIE